MVEKSSHYNQRLGTLIPFCNISSLLALIKVWALKEMFFIHYNAWSLASTFVGLVNASFFKICCQEIMSCPEYEVSNCFLLRFCLFVYNILSIPLNYFIADWLMASISNSVLISCFRNFFRKKY